MSFDDDYYELNFWYGWPMKDVKLYFQPGAVSEILIISNLWHATSRTWTCAKPEVQVLLNDIVQ